MKTELLASLRAIAEKLGLVSEEKTGPAGMGTEALKGAPPVGSTPEVLADYAKDKAREWYPSDKYSDADLKDLTNNIADLLAARGTDSEQTYKDTLNVRTPVIPTTPIDTSTVTGAGPRIAATAANKYNERLVNTGSQMAAVHAMGNPLDTVGGVFGGIVDWGKAATGFASGGSVLSTGFAKVHAGEPIIPANVANSSNLQEQLTSIANNKSSGGDTSNNHNTVNIYMNGQIDENNYQLRSVIRRWMSEDSRSYIGH